MNDEFLLRVDEELPSDQRTAVKVVETKVMSEEYRTKLETVIEKLEAISAINNADVLKDMKDILSGLLDSMTAINSKYSFLSEMVLKLDEKAPSGINERIGKLSEGIADILADIQTSLADIKSKDSQDPLIGDSVMKLEEKMNELSVISAELGEKIESIMGENRGMIDSIEEKLGDLSVSNASVLEKMENMEELGDKFGTLSNRVEDKMGELSGNISSLEERVGSTREVAEAIESLKSSVAGLESRSDVAADLIMKIEEKLSDTSIEMMEALDKLDEKAGDVPVLKEVIDGLEEKVNNVAVANSELLGGMSDSIRNIENRHDAVSDALAGMNEKLIEMASDPKHAESMNEKMNGLLLIIERLNEKITDISMQNSGIMEGIEGMDSLNKDALSKTTERINAVQNNMLDALNMQRNSSNQRLEDIESKINAVSRDHEELSRSVIRVREEIETIRSRMVSEHEEIVSALNAMDATRLKLVSDREEILAAIRAVTVKPAVQRTKPARKRAKRVKAARKKPKRRTARRRRTTRRARRAPRVTNETLDTLIVSTLNAASMNIAQLRESTKIGEKKLRERLDVLMARGVVIREKRGRFTFYVSQAEQSMPTG